LEKQAIGLEIVEETGREAMSLQPYTADFRALWELCLSEFRI